MERDREGEVERQVKREIEREGVRKKEIGRERKR